MPLFNPQPFSVAGQTGIPLVIPGGAGATMGDNGAMSGITAVAQAYANAYVYLPANAISAGSAAGLYYAVFSSTSAARVYNNTYTSGVPSIPASPTPFATTGPGSFTAPITEITLVSISVPANSMGPNGVCRLDSLWSNNNSGNSKTLRAKFGATTVFQTAQSTNVGEQTVQFVRNRGVTNAQVAFSAGIAPYAGSSSTNLFPAADTTAAVTVAFTAQLANAADTATLEACSVSTTFAP